MRGRGWVVVGALAFASMGAVSPAKAQTGALVMTRGARTISAALARHRGWAAYDLRVLEGVGGSVTRQDDGATLVLFGDTLRFQDTSTYFETPRGVVQLAYPAYARDEAFFLPRSFFVDWLPARYGRWLGAGPNGKLVVRSVAAEPSGRRIVVLDPGHGGVDAGKVSASGVREKDVALAVARQLRRVLRSRGYTVYMTREADTLVALADRPRLANAWKGEEPAAMFVSIHANSHRQSAARGFETFFLSEARTEDERRVAEVENSAAQFEAEGSAEVDPIAQIAASLRNDFYQRASNDLAAVIQRNLAGVHPGPNRGVKQASFRVLVGALMPAVLVETAFLSNPREARLLGEGGFRTDVAEAVAEAIDAYFKGHEHLWVAQSE
ncbi:MAG: N-acetylmuramoyl-L-alanine amidase [Gemmatimonadota bacterium]